MTHVVNISGCSLGKELKEKHLAAVMSQFRVDEIGHAKIISVNLCVAANCALVLPRGIRL